MKPAGGACRAVRELHVDHFVALVLVAELLHEVRKPVLRLLQA